MNDITEKLAEALRGIRNATVFSADGQEDTASITIKRGSAEWSAMEKSLAEYDAQRPENLPTIFRVTWEIDAYDAMSPREAAEEAREAMLRASTTATVFTVRGRDGSITEVDLSEDA